MQRDNRKKSRTNINIPIHAFDGKTHIEGTTINSSGSELCYSRPDTQTHQLSSLTRNMIENMASESTVTY